MGRIKVVLDTNVLYAGLYSTRGVSFQVLSALEKRIRIALSTTLLYEYEDILRRKQSELGFSDKQIEIVLDELCAVSEHQKIWFLWRPCLPDPKDDHVLELAIAASVDGIVTHNSRDFAMAKQFGIKVLTPKQLLEVIR